MPLVVPFGVFNQSNILKIINTQLIPAAPLLQLSCNKLLVRSKGRGATTQNNERHDFNITVYQLFDEILSSKNLCPPNLCEFQIKNQNCSMRFYTEYQKCMIYYELRYKASFVNFYRFFGHYNMHEVIKDRK